MDLSPCIRRGSRHIPPGLATLLSPFRLLRTPYRTCTFPIYSFQSHAHSPAHPAFIIPFPLNRLGTLPAKHRGGSLPPLWTSLPTAPRSPVANHLLPVNPLTPALTSRLPQVLSLPLLQKHGGTPSHR